MKESDFPLYFWDYCVERQDRINNLTSKSTFSLHGANTYTSLIGKEGDISNLCQYKWYDWCYYRDHKERFHLNLEFMGRVLGPETCAGNKMLQKILKSDGYVVPRHNLLPLHVDELHSPEEHKKRNFFCALIERRWGKYINPPPVPTTSNDNIWE